MWYFAALQSVFLRIESILYVRTLGAIKQKSRAGRAREHGRAQYGAHLRIMQDHIKCVVHLSSIAFNSDIGGDCLRSAEEQQRLIDQVRPQIKEYAAARPSSLAPGG